ncbi:putative phage abortive infection protein [Sphingobacterium sp. UBA6320]|uniref:putative phage abortive infection protein n=1 Tax=Sphingobacterium sp. UBA6320 TaxID=1947510 RepID=UPI0025EA71E2|nr:putative phage abortive infection protein [Sphingobacterium sp. UBA6320]
MYLLPEVYTLFISFLFITSIVLSVYIILQKQNRFEKNNDDYTAKWTYLFFGIAVLLIVFSIFAPFIFTAGKAIGDFDSNTASTGDTLGGIMGPFIAIAGVIVTGLAFYIQYKANQQILDQVKSQDRQYRIDKFESQFYEMLRLHKENVNEMSIEGYVTTHSVHRKSKDIYSYAREDKMNLNGKNNRLLKNKVKDQSREKKEITGRKVFYLMVKELEACFQVIKAQHYPMYKSEYIINNGNVFLYSERRYELFRLAYHIFFSGKDVLRKQIDQNEIEVIWEGNTNVDYYEDLLQELKILRTSHKYGVRHLKNYFSEELVSQDLYLDFSYLPFGGHQIRLGHYYRHMLSLVKHVVDQPNDFLTYEDKRKYLKIFRAQLSNHEVVLLFYNWLGEYGCAWEEDVKDSMGRNKYFTDYRILHNLNKHLVLNEFDPLELFNSTEFVYKKGQKKTDLLFELYGTESSLNEDESSKLKSC